MIGDAMWGLLWETENLTLQWRLCKYANIIIETNLHRADTADEWFGWFNSSIHEKGACATSAFCLADSVADFSYFHSHNDRMAADDCSEIGHFRERKCVSVCPWRGFISFVISVPAEFILLQLCPFIVESKSEIVLKLTHLNTQTCQDQYLVYDNQLIFEKFGIDCLV